MNQDYKEFLSKVFLFRDINIEAISKLCDKLAYEISDYLKDEVIYSPSDAIKKIGFVYSGECGVFKHRQDGSFVCINRLTKQAPMGIISVLSGGDEFPTYIKAIKQSRVIFIDKEQFIKLIESCSQISLNVINFLCNRIIFLNDKISTYSSGNIEEKIVNHILSCSKNNQSNSIIFNKKQASEAVGCGRASLYRALDALQSEGLIKLDNKNLIILDREGLERYSK